MSVAIWIGGREEVRMPSYVAADDVFGNFMSTVLAGQPIEQFPTSDEELEYTEHDFGHGYGADGEAPEHEGDTVMTPDEETTEEETTGDETTTGGETGGETPTPPSGGEGTGGEGTGGEGTGGETPGGGDEGGGGGETDPGGSTDPET